MRPDTRSGLWAHAAYAIDQLRPGLVVIENVRGLLSADAHHPAHSDLEPCPWCVGDDHARPLRALGAVLGELAELGYDAIWQGLRAADVGAPHGRFRVFVVAWPAADAGRLRGITGRLAAPGEAPGRRALAVPGVRRRVDAAADAACDGRSEGWPEPARIVGGSDAAFRRDAATDTDCDRLEGQPRASSGRDALRLDEWDDADGRDRGAAAADADRDALRQQPVAEPGCCRAPVAGHAGIEWGPYADAIRRWERRIGRPAPAPTELTAKASLRLSLRFVEWMMGLPAGWVTDVPGLGRNEKLKALGNGVVPQQAAEALRRLLES
jgi:DNA (cytosine-5)-methyltransferase 1